MHQPAPGGSQDPFRQLAAARRTARMAQALAGVAVVVAILAVVLSMAALADGRRTATQPTAANPATSTADSGAVSATATAPPSPSTGPTRSAPVNTATVRPEADFKLVYERQALRVAPPKGCEQRFVDLDEPRVGVAQEVAEFGYGGPCGGGPKPEIDVVNDLPISTADGNAIARDCAEAIRNGPINEPLVPTDQTSLCLLTSASAADKEGISRKLVLVTIDSIAQDGTMNLLVTAWSVPT